MTRKEQKRFERDNDLHFTEIQDDEKERLKQELSCIGMIDSVICYGKCDVDYILNNKYIKEYIDSLGFERVKELAEGQVNENPYIKKNVYTDCDGLSYNALIFKDEEGYIYE